MKLQSNTPTAILDESGEHISVNEAFTEMFDTEEDEVIGEDFHNFVLEDKVELGRTFERVVKGGAEEQVETTVQNKSGDPFIVSFTLEPGAEENTVQATIHECEKCEPGLKNGDIDQDFFDNLTDYELKERMENIRVDGPAGSMSLKEIVFDLAVGHDDIQNYKQGALTLHSAVSERLEEEEQRNPGSVEAKLLKEVKRDIFGLYLRVQRGDEELFGNRPGKYSGYFDDSETDAEADD